MFPDGGYGMIGSSPSDSERALGIDFTPPENPQTVIPANAAMQAFWQNLQAVNPAADPNANRPAGCTCGTGGQKCCTCFYETQPGCSGLSQANCTNSAMNGNSSCSWFPGEPGVSPARCVSAWQKECIDLLNSQTPACGFKQVIPKAGDLLADPDITWPTNCTNLFVAHRGHGTGFGQCSTTTNACVTGCGDCLNNVAVSWGGCNTLTNYQYNPTNPNDPINQLIAGLPAECTATVQASPTTDMMGCRQNYVTIQIVKTNGTCGVTVTPPPCGGRCASVGDTQSCTNNGTTTNQICCGDQGTQGRCGYGECHFRIGNSCN